MKRRARTGEEREEKEKEKRRRDSMMTDGQRIFFSHKPRPLRNDLRCKQGNY